MLEDAPSTERGLSRSCALWIRLALLTVSAAFFALHFVHLGADFPNDSPWIDWAKYTDEGWYSDAATRHFLFGHWYLPGDFNPAVALPVWPLLLAGVFHVTGVSLVAARAVAVFVFGLMLCAMYWLIVRFADADESGGQASFAAPIATLLFCASPFFFAFDRLAILEPLLAALTVMALLTASFLLPWSPRQSPPATWFRVLLPQIVLGLLLPAMVLTKTTAVALTPAVACMLWHRAGCRLRPALRMAALPLMLAAALWLAYMLLLVRPPFLEDYEYLFSANAYTGFQLQPLATVLFNTFADGSWMGTVLYSAFFLGILLFLSARPLLFRKPLAMSLLFWIIGYFAFLAYHNNLQPRYYLVLAVPVTVLVALMLDAARLPAWAQGRFGSAPKLLLSAVLVCAIVVPDAIQQIHFLLHPDYTFRRAAQALAAIVRSQPSHPERILSVSGSDLTLMTGLPSIDDDFGTLDLDQRVRKYPPGWYVAWNQIDDDKMDALTPLYHPIRVAAFPVMDDPDRNELILYRLDPASTPTVPRHRRPRIPRALRTRLGQQPTTTQLQH